MTERPILFSAPMVRAILEGRKTQTRRVLKDAPKTHLLDRFSDGIAHFSAREGGIHMQSKVLYAVGDLLWVRETWGVGTRPFHSAAWRDGIEYRADDDGSGEDIPLYDVVADLTEIKTGWRPSVHMPRWASRITLRVTGVKVERLQQISEDAAAAEGVRPPVDVMTPQQCAALCRAFGTDNGMIASFAAFWEEIIGPWDANPWVAAISFERVV
jgi:hypothetical protein